LSALFVLRFFVGNAVELVSRCSPRRSRRLLRKPSHSSAPYRRFQSQISLRVNVPRNDPQVTIAGKSTADKNPLAWRLGGITKAIPAAKSSWAIWPEPQKKSIRSCPPCSTRQRIHRVAPPFLLRRAGPLHIISGTVKLGFGALPSSRRGPLFRSPPSVGSIGRPKPRPPLISSPWTKSFAIRASPSSLCISSTSHPRSAMTSTSKSTVLPINPAWPELLGGLCRNNGDAQQSPLTFRHSRSEVNGVLVALPLSLTAQRRRPFTTTWLGPSPTAFSFPLLGGRGPPEELAAGFRGRLGFLGTYSACVPTIKQAYSETVASYFCVSGRVSTFERPRKNSFPTEGTSFSVYRYFVTTIFLKSQANRLVARVVLLLLLFLFRCSSWP